MDSTREQFAFGPFRVDTRTFRLFRDGVEVALRPQVFRVLVVLSRNLGHQIDYRQMIQEGWNGVPVSRHTVVVTIVELRKVLQEYGSCIRYRPRLGFCLDIPEAGEFDDASARARSQYPTDAKISAERERERISLEENKKLILDYYDAVHRRDFEAVKKRLANDFVDHEAPPGTPPGPEAVLQAFEMTNQAFPDLRITIEDILAEGDRVAVRAHWTGTREPAYSRVNRPPANHSSVITDIVFWRIRDGQIVERWAALDRPVTEVTVD